MPLPVPYYRTPNLYVSPGPVAVLINANNAITSGVQNKNGGVIAYGRPGPTQSRFHLENNGQLVGKVSDRVGGYPTNTVALGAAGASGAMGVTTIKGLLPFGKVYPQQYIVFGLKSTQQVAGSGTTLLQSAGARFNGVDKAVQNRNPGYYYTPHYIMQNGGYSNLLGWNYITGRLLSDNASGTQDNLGTDFAANPTRALPGQLVFLDAGKTISSGYYKSKTN